MMRAKPCPVCRGSKTIRLPHYEPVDRSALAPLPVVKPDQGYPCPACSEFVPVLRVYGLKRTETFQAHPDDDSYQRYCREQIAQTIGMFLLEKNLIAFTKRTPTKADLTAFGTQVEDLQGAVAIVLPGAADHAARRIERAQIKAALTLADRISVKLLDHLQHYPKDLGDSVLAIVAALTEELIKRPPAEDFAEPENTP